MRTKGLLSVLLGIALLTGCEAHEHTAPSSGSHANAVAVTSTSGNEPDITNQSVEHDPVPAPANTGSPTTPPAPPSPQTPSRSNPSVPKSKTIVIDPGHGGPDSGATGIGGILEKDLTLLYANAAKAELEARGYQVFLTRTTDVAVNPHASDVESEIRSRTSLSAKVHASLYVSIHMNWFDNPSANGTETFYNNSNHREGLENPYPEQSILLAKSLESHITAAMHTRDRGVADDELYNLITNTVPAALVEVGFISNQGDVHIILDPSGRAAFAKGFADAIEAYFAELK